MNERFWSDTEKEIVRRYYPQGGALACQAHLPSRRTVSAIYALAKKLDLKGSKRQVGVLRQHHEVTPELDEKIKREWSLFDGRKRGEVTDLAERLGVPRWWLSQRARKLGLTIPHKKEPPWTKVEDALMAKVPLHDPDRCAKVFREHGFNRSPSAIMVHAKRTGLSRRFSEGLSATQAAGILGVNPKTLSSWCVSGELRASRRDDRRLPQQGGSRWIVKPVDLRQFVIDNLGRMDFRKVDKFALVRLLITEGQQRSGRSAGWSAAEDRIVRGGYSCGLTISQVIDELERSGFRRRSQANVSSRAGLLGCVSRHASDAWSEREDRILRDAYGSSVRIAGIVGLLAGEGFNRSRGAVQMRAISLGLSSDRVRYWSPEETRIALDGLRAGKTHDEVRKDLVAAGYDRGPTAMAKFAKKHFIQRKQREFTEEELNVLRSHYNQGMPAREIAARIGRTVSSVASQASKMGLKQRRSWTGEERQLLVDYQASSRSMKDAAKAIGRPYANVAAECRRMNLLFRRPMAEGISACQKQKISPHFL